MADADDCPYCATGHKAQSQVLIPLLRKVMPNQIAADILSVQPMTGPMWPEMGWDCGLTFEHEVRFSTKHDVYKLKNECRMWALENLRGLYTYRSIKRKSQPGKSPNSFLMAFAGDDWVWTFQDPRDAVLFKVRWV